jgi:hypothetical protein
LFGIFEFPDSGSIPTMMKRTFHSLLVSAVCFAWGSIAMAQEASIPGWHPLPDSLFTVWRLESDQIRRLRVIEEDHNTERVTILSSALPATQKEAKLQELAGERRREIRAVLQVRQFEDWERRYAGLDRK